MTGVRQRPLDRLRWANSDRSHSFTTCLKQHYYTSRTQKINRAALHKLLELPLIGGRHSIHSRQQGRGPLRRDSSDLDGAGRRHGRKPDGVAASLPQNGLCVSLGVGQQIQAALRAQSRPGEQQLQKRSIAPRRLSSAVAKIARSSPRWAWTFATARSISSRESIAVSRNSCPVVILLAGAPAALREIRTPDFPAVNCSSSQLHADELFEGQPMRSAGRSTSAD